jgi:hypothetical protein
MEGHPFDDNHDKSQQCDPGPDLELAAASDMCCGSGVGGGRERETFDRLELRDLLGKEIDREP